MYFYSDTFPITIFVTRYYKIRVGDLLPVYQPPSAKKKKTPHTTKKKRAIMESPAAAAGSTNSPVMNRLVVNNHNVETELEMRAVHTRGRI